MGLSLVVGIISESAEDSDRSSYYQEQMGRVNQALHHAKLPAHHEPDTAAEGIPWRAEVGDFSTLHYLRRLAAYICLRNELPEPGDDDSAADPINEKWCMWATNHQPHNLLSKLVGDRVEEPIPYEHLMVHSDAEGFYLPQRFHRVVIAPVELHIAGNGLIGSAPALRDDLERVAEAIALPLDLEPDSDEVVEAAENQGRAASGWQRFGRESAVCLKLYRAATLAAATGHALAFCTTSPE